MYNDGKLPYHLLLAQGFDDLIDSDTHFVGYSILEFQMNLYLI